MTTGIYKITNPDGKIYIGQSTNVENRFKSYLNLRNVKNQIKLLNSFKKYSAQNHLFEIVEICEVLDLNEKERYWQDFYNVLCDGLNLKLTHTTSKSGKNSRESNKKISNSLLGHSVSEYTRIASSIANKGNKYCLGYKHSELFLKTLRKKVIQYSMYDEYIREWDSIKSAAISLSSNKNNTKSKEGSITNCLIGISKSALGYKWKYKL